MLDKKYVGRPPSRCKSQQLKRHSEKETLGGGGDYYKNVCIGASYSGVAPSICTRPLHFHNRETKFRFSSNQSSYLVAQRLQLVDSKSSLLC